MGLIKIIASILVLMAFVVAAQAQVTVTLVNGEGKPVAEATVEANKKVIGKTDADGSVTLDTSYLNQQLCFSHVSFQLFCEKVTKNVNKFTLKSNDNFLDVAVVTSYENTTRRNTIGNVSSIDMSKVPVLNTSNTLSALQGLAPGLDITIPSGNLGQASKVRVQGDQSIFFSAPPIYVIDGMVVSEYTPSNDFNMTSNLVSISNQRARSNYTDFLDWENVESVTILKDADAVAIYGSRGANGAIVIQTKKAKKNNINIGVNFNVSRVGRKIDLMNTSEYLYMRRKAIVNDGITNLDGINFQDLTLFDSTENNDWQNILMGHSISNYSLRVGFNSISDKISNRISFQLNRNRSFFDETSNFKDYKISNATEFSVLNNKVKIFNSINLGFNNSEQSSIDLTTFALTAPPNFPKDVLNKDTIKWLYKDIRIFNTFSDHPYYNYQNNRFIYSTSQILNNVNLSYDICDVLKLNVNYGYSLNKSDDKSTRILGGDVDEYFPTVGGMYNFKQYKSEVTNLESFISLNNVKLSNHIYLNNVIGINYNASKSDVHYFSYQGNPPKELADNIRYYSDEMSRVQVNNRYKYAAAYNRLNFVVKNFIITGNYRFDGSSRFAPENRWSSFYSLGVGWTLSNSEWFKNSDFFIKVRSSIGKLGNDNIPDYGYLEKYSFIRSLNYPDSNIIVNNQFYSQRFRWENTMKSNLGIDFTYKKLSLIMDYSYTIAKDQLIDYTLPPYLGQSSVFRNFPGIFRNTSLEMSIGYLFNLSRDFEISSKLNITFPRNKLIEFPNIENSSYSRVLNVGMSLGAVYRSEIYGVDKESGKYIYLTENKDFTFNQSEANYYFIDTKVNYYASFILSARLKRIKLSCNIYNRNESSILASQAYMSATDMLPGNKMNNYKSILNNWDRDINSDIQKFTSLGIGIPLSYPDKMKNNFIRMNSINIEYLVDNIFNSGKSVSISAYVNNILLYTNLPYLNYESLNNRYLPPLQNFGLNLNINF